MDALQPATTCCALAADDEGARRCACCASSTRRARDDDLDVPDPYYGGERGFEDVSRPGAGGLRGAARADP